MALEKSKTMFDDCSSEKSPKNLDDCLRQDKVTVNLWSWAHNLEVIGRVLLFVIIIAGIIYSINNANAPKQSINSYGELQENTEFSTTIFFTSILTWGIYAIVEYCIYHLIALLVGSLASIVYHTKVTAKIAELQYRDEIPTETKKENGYKTSTGNNSIFNTNNSAVSDDGTWLCDSCGCRNQKSTKYCKSCGKSQ